MALLINVASLQSPVALRHRVSEEMEYLRHRGFSVNMREVEYGELTFIGCSVEEPKTPITKEEAFSYLRCFLAEALADIIVVHCEEKLVRQLVRQKYSNFSSDEQHRIVELTLANDRYGFGKLYDRHSWIVNKLLDYLMGSDTIVLEGFVRFRLREYQQELKTAISYAAEDVEGEREYQEFTRLLRCLVSSQDPIWPVVQVLPKINGRYRLLDKQDQLLVLGDLWGNINGQVDLSEDDLLISTLVCLSPLKIVLHKELAGTNLGNMIKNVFLDRVSFCFGCKLCDNNDP